MTSRSCVERCVPAVLIVVLPKQKNKKREKKRLAQVKLVGVQQLQQQ